MSRARRLIEWLRSWRGVPARTERVDRLVAHTADRVDALEAGATPVLAADTERSELLRRIDEVTFTVLAEGRGRHDDVAGWINGVEQQLAATRLLVESQQESLAIAAHERRVAMEASLAERRDRVVGDLIDRHTVTAERRSGVSVITITWNHAGWMREAAASAAAVLEALGDDGGVHLILDDASSDETAEVLAELAHDPRVVVISSPSNLNLARARNVLLAACPTSHAMVLDADNRLVAGGVTDLWAVARAHGAAITYGQVIASDDRGGNWNAYAYAPSWESLRTGLCFDSMAMIDVDAVQALGGYSVDPQLAGVVDDLELLLRTLRRDRLVVFVPTVVGRYRAAAMRHSALVAHQPSALRRVERMYLYDDPDLDTFPVAAIHPATGVLWAWPGARRFVGEPSIDLRPSDPVDSDVTGPTVLVVAPGGVGNLGDDAISDAVIRRVRRDVPGAQVEVISDRHALAPTAGPVVWNCTVLETWRGLDDELLVAAATLLGVEIDRLRPDVVGPTVIDLAAFDLVVFAGGGNLADPFGDDVMLPRLVIAAAAAALGVPVVWSGQGLGPLAPDRLDLVQRVVAASQAFGCRDEGSVQLANGSAVGGTRAVLIGDDAIDAASAPEDEVAAALRRSGVSSSRYVVAHLRDAAYVGDVDLAHLVRAVDEYAVSIDAEVVCLAINDNAPSEASLFASVVDGAVAAPWRLLDVAGRSDVTVGVLTGAHATVSHSYHVALWSLANGTPALLVAGSEYYERKATGLADLLGIEGGVDLAPDATAPEVGEQLRQVEQSIDARVVDGVTARVDGWVESVVPARVTQ
ncbi:MAG: polysaccharide pyruvyl transferase family protein [Microthrixaceae bacterium]